MSYPELLICNKWIFFWEVAVLLPLLAVAYFNHSCVVSCPRFGFALILHNTRVLRQGQKTDLWGWSSWSGAQALGKDKGGCLKGTVIQRVTSDDPCGSFQLSIFCNCSAVTDFSLDHSSQWWCYHKGQVWEWDLIQHSLLVGSTQWQAVHPDFSCAHFSLNMNFIIFKIRVQMQRTISNASNFIADASSLVKMKDMRRYRNL